MFIQRMTDAVAERLQQIQPDYLAVYPAEAAFTVAAPPASPTGDENNAIPHEHTDTDEAEPGFCGILMLLDKTACDLIENQKRV